MLLHEFTGKSICKPVSFEIKQGNRIVLDGKNGAGKSSLLKMLVGEHIEQSGTVSIGSGLVVSYVQQDTSDLEGSLSKFAETNNIEESLFKAILRKLDFPRIQFEKNGGFFCRTKEKSVACKKSL